MPPREHLQAHGRKVVGYSQARRRRLRDTQQQVATIISARTRDHRDTLAHLERGLAPDLRELACALREPSATAGDVRAALASLAATATILAEQADCPDEHVLEGSAPSYSPGDDPDDYGFVVAPIADEYGVRTATRCEDGTVLIRLLPLKDDDGTERTPVNGTAFSDAA